MSKSKVMHRLAAALTTGLLLGDGAKAFAAPTFTTVGSNIHSSSWARQQWLVRLDYVCGIGLGVAGILKLKGHVDNPGQTPLKDGLIRLGAGGGLLAFPMRHDGDAGTVTATTSAGMGGSAQDDVMQVPIPPG